MERIQALIEQLYRQQKEAATPSQLLLTVQMLHSELLIQQRRSGSLGTAKVAVTLPNINFSEEVIRPSDEVKAEEPLKIEEPKKEYFQLVEVPEEIPVVETKAFEIPTPQPSYTLRKPSLFEEPVKEEKLQTTTIAAEHKAYLPSFDTVDEAPTLIQHTPRKEVNELIAERKESLNDRLKEQKKEVAHILKETPVKDLRKAIGINDRFLFVSELFRGDDAMYERSIKTINSFHVLSEAEYWINRELKVKLAWNDDKETVQHFYHLVRRRFA